MNLKLLALQFVQFMSARGYSSFINNKVFNPLSKNILYTNSGIAGIYEKFIDPYNSAESKIASVQTCLRVDGKHNDIENIGTSLNHMCCFQMLGVFSLVDACLFTCMKDIFDFLSGILNKDLLSITIHPDDEYLKEQWHKICPGIKVKCDSENIWRVSASDGLFGTCTEIYYGDLEIWNIVIISSELKNGEVIKLDQIMVDTGGGLERIYMCKNNLKSIFDIHEYKSFISLLTNENPISVKDARIILDHLRASDSILSSKIPISNSKRGYILKKFVRKVAYLLTMSKLSVDFVLQSGSSMLINQIELSILLESEVEMAEACIRKFDRLIANKESLSSEDLFKLQDTHGILIDISVFLCELKGIKFDIKSIDNFKNSSEKPQIVIKEKVEGIDKTDFIYNAETLSLSASEIVIVKNNQSINKIQKDENLDFISKQTIFYPEMGGQKNDTGEIFLNHNNKSVKVFEVLNVVKKNGLIFCKVISISNFSFDNSYSFTLKINEDRRHFLSASHSAHHILHSIINSASVGKNTQVSSLIDVNESKVSFFNYFSQQFSIEQINYVLKNIFINNEFYLENSQLPFNEAVDKGYIFLPFENYPNNVSLVKISDKSSLIINSVEICAGTHSLSSLKLLKSINVTKIQKSSRFINTYKFAIELQK